MKYTNLAFEFENYITYFVRNNMHTIQVEKLGENNFNAFLTYLKNHLSENGDHQFFFLPLTKEQSKFSSEWEIKFRNGLQSKIRENGWRQVWIAVNHENTIVGHVDIRPHTELNTKHRVVLGMGTDSQFRNLKIGNQLLKFIIEFCKNQPDICWLDLDVLSNNAPAIRLYEKMEFQLVSSIQDMFRINNQSYSYKSMTLNVDSKKNQ